MTQTAAGTEKLNEALAHLNEAAKVDIILAALPSR